MSVIVNGQELTLSGTVGADWFDDGFTHPQVVQALAGLDGDITVRLNSGGGYAADGAAIHATFASYPGKVSVIVEGIAASAASLIAMAGDTIVMADGAVMMIHDPENFTIGNSEEHQKTIDELEAYATAYAKVYAARSGKTMEECRTIMKATTWFNGEEAVAAGFADEVGPSKAKPVAAYDYRAYANTPTALAAKARAKGWTLAKYTTPAASAANEKEPEMATDKERADALAAELATLKVEKATADAALAAAKTAADEAVKADRERRTAIMSLDEAKGREALAEHLFATGMAVEQAKATLAVAPAANTETPEGYEAQRLAGAELGGGNTEADAGAGAWAKVIAKRNAGFKK